MRIAALLVVLLIAGAVSTPALETPDSSGWTWRFVTGGPVVGLPAVDSGGTIYFAAADRYLYAVARNGSMKWRTDLSKRPSGILIVGADGTIYTGLEDGRLIAVNKDGQPIWEFAGARGRLLPPVALSNGTLIIGDRTGQVVCVTHAGVEVWRIDLGEQISSAPVFSFSGQTVFGTERGNIVMVDPAGSVVQRRYVAHVPSAIAPIPGGLRIGTTSGHLLGIAADGTPLWRTDLGSAVAELLAGPGGDSYCRLDDGSLVHVSADGVVTWRANPTPAEVRSIAISDGVLTAISGGSIANIGPDGSLRWQMELPDDPLEIMPTTEGDVLLSSAGWVTYSYPLGLTTSGPWPLRRGTPRGAGVPSGVVTNRPGSQEPSDSLDYIYLTAFLKSPFEADQLAGLRDIESRVGGTGFAGSYPYVLTLCEDLAGAPYYGPASAEGPLPVSRSARVRAVSILGRIGDLGTAKYLLRLFRAEEDATMQVALLAALSQLRTGAQGEAVPTVSRKISETLARVPSDQLAEAAIRYLEAVHDYEGGFLSTEGVSVLTGIASGPYGQKTRAAARGALERLAAAR